MSNHYLVEVSEPSEALQVAQTKNAEPKRYKVIILNDDYTPMDFVVEVLQYFFHMAEAIAIQVMLEVHHHGRAVCGIFTRDIAETKVALVNDYATKNEHPLLCYMERE